MGVCNIHAQKATIGGAKEGLETQELKSSIWTHGMDRFELVCKHMLSVEQKTLIEAPRHIQKMAVITKYVKELLFQNFLLRQSYNKTLKYDTVHYLLRIRLMFKEPN